MRKDFITFRSITPAQRGQRILRNSGIEATLQRTPGYIQERGCGYCLRLQSGDVREAMEILRREKLPYERVYAVNEDGSTQERMI